MPLVVPVKFTYASRDLWFDPQDLDILEADYAICSTERGTEIGLVTADPFEVPQDEIGQPLKPVLRVASDIDLQLADDLAIQGDEAMVDFRRLVKELDLEMKPVGVEYLFGGEKAVFYFAAEERVDFRQLVKDLSSTLHIRVDMRQIGVREEAALMGGFGHCGQELCCTRFGSGFEPVSIRMAKEQDLPLNSNKISGACGRLMCCLRYEFEAYRDFKQRAPKKNAVIQTPLGTAKIVEYDTPKEQLALRLENGKQIRVPLGEMEASDAAKKKSEELGCPCRPDTVLRSTMERLNSPEVRAALEELDRKNGLIPEETFASEDIFVSESRSGRRRRNKGGNKGQRPEAAQQPAEKQTDAAQGQKRRRRHKTVEVSGDAAENLPGQAKAAPEKQSAPGEGRRSRRRHHVEGEQQAEQREQQRSEARHERRHNAPKQDAEKAGEQQASEGQGQQKRRRRRRPGDKGGAAAEGQRPQQTASSETRKPKHMAPQADKAQQGATDGDAPKRKRRRRHRGGGNGGSAPNPGTPASE